MRVFSIRNVDYTKSLESFYNGMSRILNKKKMILFTVSYVINN